jgi:hypothetical protein
MKKVMSIYKTFIQGLLFFLLGSLPFIPVRALTQDQGGRNQLPLFNSPAGPVMLFGGGSINAASADNKGVHYSLSRTEVNGTTTKQLPLPGMVRNLSSFKKAVGAALIAQLQHSLKLSSEEALWAYLQQHADLSAYGLASFNIPFRGAMGAAYVDGEVKDKKGKTYTYALSLTVPGQAAHTVQSTVTIGQAPDFSGPRLTQVRTKDSLVTISWQQKLGRDVPFMASVYRQSGDRGEYSKLPSRIMARQKGDSVSFLFTDKANGNSAYRYFIRPADLLNNAGLFNSDTAALVVSNFRKMPKIADLQARDTMNGIMVSWRALPVDPLITGIEIQRSRDSRGDFVAVDTVSPMAHSYMDTRLVPHIAYYYRLCALHAGKQAQDEKFYASVSADQQKTTRIPDAPYGIHALSGPGGVRIAWQPVNDPDFYAYFVYRGTSLGSAMQVISPALTDTVFSDTASNLSRKVAYVYAVRTVTNGNKASALSGKVSALLPRGKERPLTPGGIRLSPRPDGLYIEWDDTKKNDPSITGYILYKHRVGPRPLAYDVAKPATDEATRLNLQVAVGGIITVPYYTDALSQSGNKDDKYEYLVCAVDNYGAVSGLSPAASSSRMAVLQQRPPSKVFARAVPEGVALQWEQADPSGIEAFAIYRRAITERSPRKIAQINGTSSQFTDRQAAKGNLYVYTITALTGSGETAPSDERTVRK